MPPLGEDANYPGAFGTYSYAQMMAAGDMNAGSTWMAQPGVGGKQFGTRGFQIQMGTAALSVIGDIMNAQDQAAALRTKSAYTRFEAKENLKRGEMQAVQAGKIEAAQIACNIAPGMLRGFGFEKLLPFQPHVWDAIKNEAAHARRDPQPVKCVVRERAVVTATQAVDVPPVALDQHAVARRSEDLTADDLKRAVVAVAERAPRPDAVLSEHGAHPRGR